jgi:hypothetical protein
MGHLACCGIIITQRVAGVGLREVQVKSKAWEHQLAEKLSCYSNQGPDDSNDPSTSVFKLWSHPQSCAEHSLLIADQR